MRRLATISCFAVSMGWPAYGQDPPRLDVPPVVPFGSGAAGGARGCAPANLTRMVVRNVSPGLAAAAPAAQPRTLWRQGRTFLRSEESPDPARGQSVVIVAEPDIWTLDLATRSGQHQTDPGPELVVRAPILPITSDLPPAFRALEYGCEFEFLLAAGAADPRQTVNWGAAKATVHQVTQGEHSISVLMSTQRQAPLMIAYARAGQVVFALRYDEFRNDLAERPGLFEPPKGMNLNTGRDEAPQKPKSPRQLNPPTESSTPPGRRGRRR